MMKIEGSGSISQKHGSADPDPHQNVMDPQHCTAEIFEYPTCAGGSVTVNVEVVLGLAQEMYPAAITQKDKQLVRSAVLLFPVPWLLRFRM
jgi:hypothetical protein